MQPNDPGLRNQETTTCKVLGKMFGTNKISYGQQITYGRINVVPIQIPSIGAATR
jgi:hypothetical protein